MFPSPKLRRASCSLALQPTRSAPLVSADVNNNFLKHLQVCGPFTLRFFTILPIVEIESLNTSVRVCVQHIKFSKTYISIDARYDALEPYIDEQTMRIHHGTLGGNGPLSKR